ncbi:beta-1,4-glucuronyltransferase 1-like [Penaeus japonicus]|uniref:beta-1,4-glucuronyltransferase 1-like n=1 Tax=Penaeus japonicus TaxID=27405 RepID=UPI001C70E1CD|nr:beta-1,4-glucuronyltransferase 1-like [Penaeus japonicus]
MAGGGDQRRLWPHHRKSLFCRLWRRGVLGMMASARVLVVRGSLFLNAVLVLYLCLSWLSTTPTTRLVPSSSSSSSFRGVSSAPPLPALSAPRLAENGGEDVAPPPLLNLFGAGGSPAAPPLAQQGSAPLHLPPLSPELLSEGAAAPVELRDMSLGGRRTLGQRVADEQHSEGGAGGVGPGASSPSAAAAGGEPEEPPREVQESAGVTEQLVAEPIVTEPPDPPLDSQERKMYPDLRECSTRSMRPFYQQRGDYWVLENYIPAALNFRCDESITYTTHGDYTFLDNLEPLTSRWQVGLAQPSLLLFFFFFFLLLLFAHLQVAGRPRSALAPPSPQVPTTEELLRRKTDCAQEPPRWTNVTTYRQKKKLLYPVNVARNTARQAVQTYFVLPSDVELYPSVNFIPEFFKMLKKPDVSNSTSPRVYVFSIFEVKDNVSAPETKADLQRMLKKGDAIPFHKNVCAKCHNVPMSKEWIAAPLQPGMSVFHVGKRKPPYHKWEPIYVGTNKEPLYDERLSWEGKSDKMTQMYILCVRDYEFHIMDNAFLVHRPGIKKLHKDPSRDRVVAKQNTAIRTKILPEYKTMFGYRKSCVI